MTFNKETYEATAKTLSIKAIYVARENLKAQIKDAEDQIKILQSVLTDKVVTKIGSKVGSTIEDGVKFTSYVTYSPDVAKIREKNDLVFNAIKEKHLGECTISASNLEKILKECGITKEEDIRACIEEVSTVSKPIVKPTEIKE